MTTATSNVHVVATLQTTPEQVAELVAVLTDLAQESRRQPGNLGFDVHQQSADPTRLITVERWQDTGAADTHMASQYVGAALGKLGPLLAAPPQIVRYSQIA